MLKPPSHILSSSLISEANILTEDYSFTTFYNKSKLELKLTNIQLVTDDDEFITTIDNNIIPVISSSGEFSRAEYVFIKYDNTNYTRLVVTFYLDDIRK